jgi:hypothetical protein
MMAVVHGIPGSKISRASQFGSAAAIGAKGESMTAAILERLPDHVHVFHSLAVPGWKSGDLDHGIVSNRLDPRDTKVWKAGFYWGFGGLTFRGFRRFKPASSTKTQEAAATYRGVGIKVGKPVIVVHCLKGEVDLRFLKVPGQRFVKATVYREELARTEFRPADPEIVALLSRYVDSKRVIAA